MIIRAIISFKILLQIIFEKKRHKKMFPSKCLLLLQILVLAVVMLDARPQNINVSQSGDIRIVTMNGKQKIDPLEKLP